METLQNELYNLLHELYEKSDGKCDFTEEFLNNLDFVYPFNKIEFIFSHLIAYNVITLHQYLLMREAYLARNKYLHVFEITAPRTFGENWAQNHLNKLVPELRRPSKELDADYSGQYDFWYDGIRIEVKASRAVKRQGGGTLISKALSVDAKEGFDMNFQQIKPGCCDVFVWIGVWRDVIRYWVLSSRDVESHPDYCPFHHRFNKGEGQLWLKERNIADFAEYEVSANDILSAIILKSSKAQ